MFDKSPLRKFKRFVFVMNHFFASSRHLFCFPNVMRHDTDLITFKNKKRKEINLFSSGRNGYLDFQYPRTYGPKKEKD
ncbi:Uncharacterized protein APZ42_023899 [Daphnia magna]|uniref:Uncharacterized protein n=1 Tax=Daphnia magna TaxID=35525 RepID=A0A164U8P1_9CRUS|nr:Uncharacterized protein APZ42_023899 [Daphnia magna]